MVNALKDGNDRSSMIAVDETDPTIIRRITANPSNMNGLSVNDASTGTDNGNNNGVALLDESSVPVLMALSSAGDGTLVEVYCDADGRLLIDSN